MKASRCGLQLPWAATGLAAGSADEGLCVWEAGQLHHGVQLHAAGPYPLTLGSHTWLSIVYLGRCDHGLVQKVLGGLSKQSQTAGAP